MWQGVLAQFIVESKLTGKPLGIVAAYNADFRNGRASLATVINAEVEGAQGPRLEAIRLFVAYLFEVFPLRKLTASVIDFNWHQFSWGAGKMFEEEGLQREHEYHGDFYWDVHLVAIHRDRWREYYARPVTERLELDAERAASFESFTAQLALVFDWPPAALVPAARLVEDLQCDSITLVELMGLLEEVTGTDVNDSTFAQVTNLGELWHLYSCFAFDDPAPD